MNIPSWIQDAIFYQIFPDRFANGDLSNDPPNVQPWGSPPTPHHFQGGDFKGIMQRFDYLLDLGINAIYLNPIFLSPSTHRYNTVDYYRIDPRLGTYQDFQELLKLAHSHKVKVIIDGVFNHCGRGFFAFADVLENHDNSPYMDWFHIKRFPLGAYSKGDAKNYQAWWGIKSLPKFNTNNPEVRRYLLDVARYWVEQGIDGWRLDVPNEIDDDAFWADFYEVVRGANPEAYIVGEIWEVNPRWVGDHHFDGVMNYPYRSAIIDYLNGKITPDRVHQAITEVIKAYPKENVFTLYNLLGSHDTERIRTMLQDNLEKVKLAMLWLFSLPGAPAIYYGDEIGLSGGKDPDCRRAFPWDESSWSIELREWVKKLIKIRGEEGLLRQADLFPVVVKNSPCLLLKRGEDQSVYMVMNPTGSTQKITIPVNKNPNGEIADLLGMCSTIQIDGQHLTLYLGPYQGSWIKVK